MRKRLHTRVQFQKSCLVRICFFFFFFVVVPCRVQDERLLDNNPPRRSLVTARLSEGNPRLLLRGFLRKEPCSHMTMDAWHSVSIVVVLVLLKVLEPASQPASHQPSRCRADLLVLLLLLLLLLPPHRTHKRVCGDNLCLATIFESFASLQLTFLISVPREKESLNILKTFCTRRRLCFFDPFPDYCISDWSCFCADVLLRAFQVPLLTTSFFLKSCREKKLHFDFCFFLSLWESTIEFSISSRNQKSSFASSFFP